jgi:hypothetical protein
MSDAYPGFIPDSPEEGLSMSYPYKAVKGAGGGLGLKSIHLSKTFGRRPQEFDQGGALRLFQGDSGLERRVSV